MNRVYQQTQTAAPVSPSIIRAYFPNVHKQKELKEIENNFRSKIEVSHPYGGEKRGVGTEWVLTNETVIDMFAEMCGWENYFLIEDEDAQ